MFEEMWWGKVGESVASTQTPLHHTPTILRHCPEQYSNNTPTYSAIVPNNTPTILRHCPEQYSAIVPNNTPTILRHCPLEGVAKPAVKTTQLSQFSIIHSKPQ